MHPLDNEALKLGAKAVRDVYKRQLLGAVASRRDDGGVFRQQLLGLNPPVTCGDSPR